jgi:TolB protein
MKKLYFGTTFVGVVLFMTLIPVGITTAIEGIEIPICTNPAGQYSPAIYGNRIVWMDYRNANGDDNHDIYMYDLSTQKETQITENPASQGSPSIWENRIVWVDFRNGNADIYMYDLASGVETPICTAPGDQINPKIWGDRIVWVDRRNGESHIYMYDLSTGIETPIATSPWSQFGPAIWKDKIVWVNWSSPQTANKDIFMYDLSTGTETPISTYPSNQLWPQIWENRIVWFEQDREQIFMHDVSTNEEKLIASGAHPGIFGDKIVYDVSISASRTDIYLYDLLTDEKQRLPIQPIVTSPIIYGNRIVWEDARNGTTNIYMYEIFPTVPEPLEVTIDIRPWSKRNPINYKGHGVLPVAILSTPDFDAPSQVDQNSLTFGATGTEKSLAFCKRKPKNVSKDGSKDDLVCNFYIEIAGFKCGDTEGILKGKTVSGIAIEGEDLVKIVHCK